MITRANHFSIFVLDQNSAYDFYVNKLGFKVNTDAMVGPKGRWLTVNSPNQPEVEITLMAIDDKMKSCPGSRPVARHAASCVPLAADSLTMRPPPTRSAT